MSYAYEFTPDGKNFECERTWVEDFWIPWIKHGRLTYLETDTAEQIESFKDLEKLFHYRKKIESFSNALFKRLVFNETNQETKIGLCKMLDKFMSKHLHGNADLINRLKAIIPTMVSLTYPWW